MIGFPSKEWGERVCAYIVPKPGQQISTNDLKAGLKTLLSLQGTKEVRGREGTTKSPAGKI